MYGVVYVWNCGDCVYKWRLRFDFVFLFSFRYIFIAAQHGYPRDTHKTICGSVVSTEELSTCATAAFFRLLLKFKYRTCKQWIVEKSYVYQTTGKRWAEKWKLEHRRINNESNTTLWVCGTRSYYSSSLLRKAWKCGLANKKKSKQIVLPSRKLTRIAHFWLLRHSTCGFRLGAAHNSI